MKYGFIKYKLFFAALLLMLGIPSYAISKSDGEINSQNYISIQGSSNVNEFKLINPDPAVDEITTNPDSSGRYHNIRISVDDFTSENQRMIQDFKEMIHASKHPYIKIGFERREQANFEETSGLTKFSTKITIAGISKEYTVPCEVFSKLNSGYILSGSFSIKLTDFDIDPPEKLLGLIKVNNEVCINFLFNFDSEEFLTEKLKF